MKKPKQLFWLLVLLGHLFYTDLQAQERTVTGKVSDAKEGSGIPGVGVLLKGQARGTVTDAQGNFSLAVPETGAVLIFSMIGMKTQTIEVGAQTVINVAMVEDVTELKDVVVTAAGIERTTKSLGYSTQKIDGQSLVNSRETNVVQSLAGKVAGVQITSSSGVPGGSSVIKIRGNNSLSSTTDPLFVIDGIPISNDEISTAQERDANVPFTQGAGQSNRLIDINPEDIESINVLKGAAATALYGVRAGNGAIIIKTKRGGGKGKAGPTVSYSTSIQMDQVNKLPDMTDKWSQGSGGRYSGPRATGGTSGSWGALMDTLRYTDRNAGNNWDRFGRNIVGQSSPLATGEKAEVYDNAGKFFRNAYTYNNSLSISGGTESTKYYASISHLKQNGIVPLTSFERTSLRLTSETQLTDKLRFTGSVNYVVSGASRAQQGSNLSGVMLGLLRSPGSFDNSNGATDPTDPSAYFFNDLQQQRTYRGFRGYDNPYFTINRNPFKDRVNRTIAFGELNYQILDWLRATYRIGVDYYTDNRNGGFDIGSAVFPRGRVYEDKNSRRDITSDLILTATKKLSDDLDLTVIAGHNGYSSSSEKLYSQGDNMIAPTFYSLANTDQYLTYPSYTKIQRYGVYADVLLGYKDRLFLNITGRNDWSSTLPTSRNNFFYPGVSLGYLFTEDLGMAENEWFNYGKLRASYAQVGRDAPAQALLTYYGPPSIGDGYTNGVLFPNYGMPGLGVGTTAGSSQPTLGNNKLKPETNQTLEFGTELRFLKERVTVDFTYYQISNKDQIVLAPIASSSGYQYSYINSGEIQNKGIELLLKADLVKTEDFTWGVTVNYTRNRNKVISLAPGIESLFLSGFTGSGSYAIPGQPFGVIYGGKWLRDGKGRMVIGSDGYPIIDPQQGVLGNPNPDYLMGIRNTFTYKGLSLSVLVDIRKGGQYWNGTNGALVFFGRAKLTENRGSDYVFPGVVADGNGNPTDVVNTQTVKLDQDWYQGNGGGFGNQAEDFMEDVTWTRVREVTLSYDLPKSFVSKIHFGGLSVGVFARNLLLFTNYSGIDPETNLTGGGNGGFGIDYFNMPNTRSFGGNLRVSF